MNKPIILFIFSILLISCSPPVPPMVSLSGETMGTSYSVKYVNVAGSTATLTPEQMKINIDKLLVDINQLMSTYIADSELSKLNEAQANEPFPISSETELVLQEAIRLNILSQGMLDITVGPLVNLWGFGPTQRTIKMPNQATLEATLAYVGLDQFTIENHRVIKHHPKVYIDLSTIAKGYAVDEIAGYLASEGLSNYLVEIGGEMRLAGMKLNSKWLIAIEKPLTGQRSVQRVISIGNNAIATSGDYRNYYEEDGVRYSHLINPKTGYPIQHNLVAVTVVAPTTIEADGLATALIVLGTEQGIALAENNSIAALFITKEAEQFIEYQTMAFKQQVEIIEPYNGN